MKERHYKPQDPKETPGEAYREEMNNEGTHLSDTEEQSAARDAAKIDKALTGESQKMDSVHPDELRPDKSDEMLEQERRNRE